jgi:hypothetical protein
MVMILMIALEQVIFGLGTGGGATPPAPGYRETDNAIVHLQNRIWILKVIFIIHLLFVRRDYLTTVNSQKLRIWSSEIRSFCEYYFGPSEAIRAAFSFLRSEAPVSWPAALMTGKGRERAT